MSFLPTLLTFLAVLSILVLAHELGHFITAKRAGIKVREFGFGYPPRIFGVRVGETLYSVNLLPLGGFVNMQGENAAPGDPHSFSSKSKRVRATVLIAGSAMNLLLAPLFFSAAFMIGEPVPDRVIIVRTELDSPAAAGGVQAGDVLVSLGGQIIRESATLAGVVKATSGSDLEMVVQRSGGQVHLRMEPSSDGKLGVHLQQEFATVRHSPVQAFRLGLERTKEMLVEFVLGMKQMVLREVPADLSGPVGIASMTGRAAQAGPSYLLQFCAFLSLNLAVFNMLPFPGLDGARLSFVLLETIRGGRRLNPRAEGMVHLAGMLLLMTFMLYISVSDVRRLVA